VKGIEAEHDRGAEGIERGQELPGLSLTGRPEGVGLDPYCEAEIGAGSGEAVGELGIEPGLAAHEHDHIQVVVRAQRTDAVHSEVRTDDGLRRGVAAKAAVRTLGRALVGEVNLECGQRDLR